MFGEFSVKEVRPCQHGCKRLSTLGEECVDAKDQCGRADWTGILHHVLIHQVGEDQPTMAADGFVGDLQDGDQEGKEDPMRR